MIGILLEHAPQYITSTREEESKKRTHGFCGIESITNKAYLMVLFSVHDLPLSELHIVVTLY